MRIPVRKQNDSCQDGNDLIRTILVSKSEGERPRKPLADLCSVRLAGLKTENAAGAIVNHVDRNRSSCRSFQDLVLVLHGPQTKYYYYLIQNDAIGN
jgi:hypothetical protein